MKEEDAQRERKIHWRVLEEAENKLGSVGEHKEMKGRKEENKKRKQEQTEGNVEVEEKNRNE